MNQITDKELRLYSVAACGVIFAWFAGNCIADENYAPIAIAFGGIFFLALFFGLGKSIYLLIPICWGLTGSITALPLPFGVRQLVIIFASVLFFFELIFKTNRIKTTFEAMDLWIVINLVYLLTVFVRNPIGFAAIGGSERVGGKPYVDVLLGVMSYLMLSRFRITWKVSKILPVWILIVSALVAIVGSVALFFPTLALKLTPYYSGFNPSGFGVYQEDVTDQTRFEFLQEIGITVVLFVLSRANPFDLLGINGLGLLFIYISGVVMILLSGYRNAMIDIMLVTTLSAILREKWDGLLKMILIAMGIALAAILLSYSPLTLPYTCQRALCFLPGHWDVEAVADAKDSSEWRYDMWQTVLTTDRYIQSKIFGDGFGFLRQDYERLVSINLGQDRLGDNDPKQEAFMIAGDFHSGPVGTIRFVGVVGLVLFLPLMFVTAMNAFQLIRRANGTPFQFCVLFVSMPIIIMPFFFIFVVGDYRQSLVTLLFDVGMLKMLAGSLRDYQRVMLPRELVTASNPGVAPSNAGKKLLVGAARR